MDVIVIDKCASTQESIALIVGGAIRVIPGIAGAFRAVSNRTPDVLLLDVCSLGRTDLVDAVRVLAALVPTADVVVLAADPERQQARDAISAGACAYVDKMDLAEVRALLSALSVLRATGGASAMAH
jgi:DNA-binding NarL/FixJ family response regulator